MDVRHIDINHLETFLAVAEERGFSRAAARLHRTQPAVSQVIRKLEEDLGEVLFERSSRTGTLTAAGEVLREYAERLLKLRAEAANAIEELRTLERGRLQLAANEYTCLYLLQVLDRFQRLYPQVGVTVQRSLASRIPEEVLARSVEIGILSFSPEGNQLRSIAVYNDELALVVSPDHPLAHAKQVTIGSGKFYWPQCALASATAGDRRVRKTQDAAQHARGAAQFGGHQALRRHGKRSGLGAGFDGRR
jgi:DNA-binding transcriptional LysR family regulator